MTQYTVIQYPSKLNLSDLSEKLTDLSKQGWETVSHSKDSDGSFSFVLRRERVEVPCQNV